MTEQIEQYLVAQRETHLEQLKEFLRIPSISTMSEHKGDLLRCATFLAHHLQEIGFENVTLLETAGNPVVYGDWLHAPGQPTVVIYGHYDVQPADPFELWETPPFEPDIRDGLLFARGASDNKGQIFAHIKAFEAYFQTAGRLPVNVKFCIEGEEEIGSGSLPNLLTEQKERFAADVVVISDTAMQGDNQPAICYGLRGMACMQIDLQGPKTDLHSGQGGALQNPLHALVDLLASMHDRDGRIKIDDFYDDVLPISEREQASLRDLPLREEELKQRYGVQELFGETGYTALERMWARPTLEINGLYGGYQGEGTKSVIPATAHAKISCRLVPDQHPDRIIELVKAHVQRHLLPGVTATVASTEDGAFPYVTPIDHPTIQLAAQAFEKAYGVPCRFIRSGGSIPVVEQFYRLYQIPVVLMGLALPTANAHAPNERFSLENFDKGIRTFCHYWQEIHQAF